MTVTAPEQSTGRSVLACEGIDLTIDGHEILSDIGLELRSGEFLAVIGPNGAGKTSLINVLSGATRPTSGAVHLLDQEATTWPPHRRAQAGLGRTFQTSNLLLGRTVLENVRLAANARRRSLRVGLRRVQSESESVTQAKEAVQWVGLDDRATRLASALSHGDRRKLELAMVLAQGSEVVLLDEPMAGVNSNDVAELVELIRRVNKSEGRSIVMVEHHMHVVLDLADRIAVMHHGRLLAVGAPDEIIANPTVQSAYVGEPL